METSDTSAARTMIVVAMTLRTLHLAATPPLSSGTTLPVRHAMMQRVVAAAARPCCSPLASGPETAAAAKDR